MTVDTSAPIAIRNPIQPRTVFRLPAVLCRGEHCRPGNRAVGSWGNARWHAEGNCTQRAAGGSPACPASQLPSKQRSRTCRTAALKAAAPLAVHPPGRPTAQ